MGVILSVIGLNCLIAFWVCQGAQRLWQWRCALAHLTDQLQNHEANAAIAPQQIGYKLTHQRMQIVQARLIFSQWQMRSRQIQQIFQLLQMLRTVLRYRSAAYRSVTNRSATNRSAANRTHRQPFRQPK